MKVVILSGFLGSGKTTLLTHILTNKQDRKVGVIVNDMATLNIDASLIKNSQLIQEEEKMIQLENGCVCCTLREDLYKSLLKFKNEYNFDHVIVESTGISEPINVAETFYIDYEEGKNLVDIGITIDQCITVLDISQVFDHLTNDMLAVETDKTSTSPYEGTLAALFIDQIEFANTIIINKLDLLPKDENAKKTLRSEIYSMIATLNPQANVIEAQYSKVPMDKIFNVDTFNLGQAQTYAGWLKILVDGKLDRTQEKLYLKSEIDEYNVGSFIYRARRPFDPTRLDELISDDFFDNFEVSRIVRSKGFFWLVHFPNHSYHWEQAGISLNITVDSVFYAALSDEEFQQIPEEGQINIKKDFEGVYGDRRQEIVFIGMQDMNEKDITQKLNACLVSDEQWEKLQKLPIEKWASTLYPNDQEREDLPFSMDDEAMEMTAGIDDEIEVIHQTMGDKNDDDQ